MVTGRMNWTCPTHQETTYAVSYKQVDGRLLFYRLSSVQVANSFQVYPMKCRFYWASVSKQLKDVSSDPNEVRYWERIGSLRTTQLVNANSRLLLSPNVLVTLALIKDKPSIDFSSLFLSFPFFFVISSDICIHFFVTIPGFLFSSLVFTDDLSLSFFLSFISLPSAYIYIAYFSVDSQRFKECGVSISLTLSPTRP